jgi:hypothetical protein
MYSVKMRESKKQSRKRPGYTEPLGTATSSKDSCLVREEMCTEEFEAAVLAFLINILESDTGNDTVLQESTAAAAAGEKKKTKSCTWQALRSKALEDLLKAQGNTAHAIASRKAVLLASKVQKRNFEEAKSRLGTPEEKLLYRKHLSDYYHQSAEANPDGPSSSSGAAAAVSKEVLFDPADFE